MAGEEEFLDGLAGLLAREKCIHKALEWTLERFRADGGTIHFFEQDGVLHLKASRGIPAEVAAVVDLVPPGKGMAGLAFERKEPVSVCNIQSDQSGQVRPGARATAMQGAVVVPILDGEKAVGALGIGTCAQRAFTDDEALLLIEAGRRIAAHWRA
jgi:GAF domain-containing protein